MLSMHLGHLLCQPMRSRQPRRSGSLPERVLTIQMCPQEANHNSFPANVPDMPVYALVSRKARRSSKYNPPQNIAHGIEISHEEFQSAGSHLAELRQQPQQQPDANIPANMQGPQAMRIFHEQASMRVVPAAWQHQVPHVFETPFSGGHHAQQQQPQQQDDRVPVNIQSHVAPLAEYHLAVPAPAGSQVLQLVSQAGLQIGDLLLIEQGTLREELMQISGFGSIV